MVVTIEPGADAWALADESATHERVTVVSCDGATATVKSLSDGAEMEVELSALSLMEPAWPAEGHVRFFATRVALLDPGVSALPPRPCCLDCACVPAASALRSLLLPLAAPAPAPSARALLTVARAGAGGQHDADQPE